MPRGVNNACVERQGTGPRHHSRYHGGRTAQEGAALARTDTTGVRVSEQDVS